jgi:8-oxo-dGTP pyrophosphatase MutT (NUDIX family)
MRPMPPPDLRPRLRAALDPAPRPEPGPGDRLAAVLVPLVRRGEVRAVFTRRTEHLPRHAGEISFPGGLVDDADPDLATTALREFAEELGVPPERVEVLGALPPVHTTVSGILVVPFVGMVGRAPAFVPSEEEIAEVLEFPLAALAAAEAEVTWPVGDHVYRGFAYEMPGATIWGLTARVLHELLEVLRKEAPWTIRP